jgi:hypothetical protein
VGPTSPKTDLRSLAGWRVLSLAGTSRTSCG